jgi:cell division transport system permease protein
MSDFFAAHGRALTTAFRRLLATPLNTLLAVLGIGIALALPAGGSLVIEQLGALSAGAAATPQLTVFLAVGADRKTARSVETRIGNLPEKAKTRLIAREETLARLKQSGDLASAIEALPGNPFPDAIVVTPGDDGPAAIERLAATLRGWKEIEHVQVDTDWAQRLAAFTRLAKTLLLLLATLLGLGLLVIVFNVIRLQALSRQAEAEVSRLLGATDAFVRRPFLWHGALLGLAGGLVAWLIVAGTLLQLRAPVAELAELYGLGIALAPPGPGESALLLGIATALGWLGAALSMRQHLRSAS